MVSGAPSATLAGFLLTACAASVTRRMRCGSRARSGFVGWDYDLEPIHGRLDAAFAKVKAGDAPELVLASSAAAAATIGEGSIAHLGTSVPSTTTVAASDATTSARVHSESARSYDPWEDPC